MLLGRVYADPNSGTSVRQASFEALSLMAGRPTVVELDDTSVRQVQELIQEINSKQS
jgi:16S rRNA G966 N2-methylase RsmD